MVAVTQPRQGIEQGFFQQRIAQPLVGQRQSQRLGHQFQIGAGRRGFRRDVLE